MNTRDVIVDRTDQPNWASPNRLYAQLPFLSGCCHHDSGNLSLRTRFFNPWRSAVDLNVIGIQLVYSSSDNMLVIGIKLAAVWLVATGLPCNRVMMMRFINIQRIFHGAAMNFTSLCWRITSADTIFWQTKCFTALVALSGLSLWHILMGCELWTGIDLRMQQKKWMTGSM